MEERIRIVIAMMRGDGAWSKSSDLKKNILIVLEAVLSDVTKVKKHHVLIIVPQESFHTTRR